jgi:hypothetical protein
MNTPHRSIEVAKILRAPRLGEPRAQSLQINSISERTNSLSRRLESVRRATPHYLGRFPSKILSISISMKILTVLCEVRRLGDQYSGTAPVFRHCVEVSAGSLAKTVSQDSEAGIYLRLALILLRPVEKFPLG